MSIAAQPRPRLLDLFCGAGGCSVGYFRAGFDVVGVDIAVQPRYPFFDVIEGDAIEVLSDRSFLAEFDVIHASPPCQAYSVTGARWGRRKHVELVEPVREILIASGKPYVIENVVGAPLRAPITLCGSMFGLGVGDAILKRHRLFESSLSLSAPCRCLCLGRRAVGVYGTGGAWTRTAAGGGGVKVSGADAAIALGIDWTDYQPALAQAIPPAYTTHIGQQILFQMAERS